MLCQIVSPINVTDFQYKHAPITEAVVEFRSPTPIDEKKRKKALKKLSKLYSQSNPVTQQTIKVKLQSAGAPSAEATDAIIDKFSSDDMTEQLIVTDIFFSISQLAPYPGWEQFEQRIKRDWNVWRSAVSFRPIDRVGMRYINRIDLPITGQLVHHEDYVTVYPALPDLLDISSHYSVNVGVNLADIQSRLNLNSAVVPSPLPDHVAIVVDLDIARIYQEPPSDEELYLFINQARAKKNEIFEACITDKARELFN